MVSAPSQTATTTSSANPSECERLIAKNSRPATAQPAADRAVARMASLSVCSCSRSVGARSSTIQPSARTRSFALNREISAPTTTT